MIRRRSRLRRRHRENQRRSFKQPAKIFFARLFVPAVGELAGGRGFVADRQALQMDDADIFITAMPDLSLSKFHL